MKTCSKCKIEKPLTFFTKDKSRKDGYHYQCKSCKMDYYNANRNHFLEYKKQYRQNNKELNKQYRQNNKEKIYNQNNKYRSNRRKTDDLYRLWHNTRGLIGKSFKRGTNQFKKNAKSESILGCTIEEFKKHIENQFKDGMNWENRSEWHLDHIIPISLAKTEEEVIKLNHYTNFQPLWAIENIRKGAKYYLPTYSPTLF